MHVESGLSRVLALKSVCVGKNLQFRYFKRMCGLKYYLKYKAWGPGQFLKEGLT